MLQTQQGSEIIKTLPGAATREKDHEGDSQEWLPAL
jgi:hypothetical protein